MSLMLGIDTGGTFTDAVVLEDSGSRVVASAKSPTTHQDLAQGVGAAVRAVLESASSVADKTASDGSASDGSVADEIVLVSVSTTLATNALVEGHGEPAALFTFGFSARELERTGLAAAVDDALVVRLAGGHDAHGNEASPLDFDALSRAVQELAPQVSAFAVAAQFSVRNPGHERAAADHIRSLSNKPVSASHDLSAKLDGPRRALTAVLNARLLGTIDRLNRAVVSVLAAESITAPLMVVRGDGSLVTADFAKRRPIETILSGPAASVIGALHLAELDSGLVVDIGGTTTDVAVIDNGKPAIASAGAVVGEHRTMVEAVEMATVGLGGDSEVRIDTRAADGPLVLGPERAISLCRLALAHPEIHTLLDRQLAAPMGLTSHGRILVSTVPGEPVVGDGREAEILARLQNGPLPMAEVATSGLEQRAAARLQARGLIRMATMTPTDACAVLGTLDTLGGDPVDRDAAIKLAQILARQTGSAGGELYPNATALAESVIEKLIDQSARFVLDVALGSDGVSARDADELISASLRNHRGAATVSIGLAAPVTAIGAPASAYYGRIAERLGTTAITPDFAEVANAVGAVVGQVRVRKSATITQPTRGQFRVHLEDQPTFGSVENARSAAADILAASVRAEADSAGAQTPKLTEAWDAKWATISDKEVFVEGVVTIEAAGRPRL